MVYSKSKVKVGMPDTIETSEVGKFCYEESRQETNIESSSEVENYILQVSIIFISM